MKFKYNGCEYDSESTFGCIVVVMHDLVLMHPGDRLEVEGDDFVAEQAVYYSLTNKLATPIEPTIFRKYEGHYWLENDRERAFHAIRNVRYTCVLADDSYTRGFIGACRKIEAKMEELFGEKS